MPTFRLVPHSAAECFSERNWNEAPACQPDTEEQTERVLSVDSAAMFREWLGDRLFTALFIRLVTGPTESCEQLPTGTEKCHGS